MTTPRISLCMIVRDEEAMLPGFFAAASGVWDELVVVDTGSRDGTRDLARAAGAKLIDFAWCDDFAAARNRGLAEATGGWILSLDADERPEPGFGAELRAAIQPGVVAATLRMVNELPDGTERVTSLLRAWQNTPAIRYRHRVHEDVVEAVRARVAADGERLVHLDARVRHLGYGRSHAETRGKKDRDAHLLALQLADDPNDLYCHYKRLELATFWGDEALRRLAAAEARAAVERAGDRLARAHYGGALLGMTAAALATGDSDAAAWLEAHAPQAPQTGALHTWRGLLLERTGRLEEARVAFEQALQTDEPTDPRMAEVRPLLGLVRLALARSRPEEARKLVARALETAPHDREALTAAVALARAAGGAQTVSAFAEDRRALAGESESLDEVLADDALRAGELEGAERLFRALAGEPPRGRHTIGLCRALLRAGRGVEAAQAAESAAPSEPSTAMAFVVARLAAGEDAAITVELTLEEAGHWLRTFSLDVLRGRSPESRLSLIRLAPSLKEAFPWYPDWVYGAS